MIQTPLSRFLCRALAAAIAVSFVALAPHVAHAQAAAATLYERAQAREKAARAAAKPSVATLRAVATAYETIVRRYPRSGYCDNALWQAAGLMELAYQQSRSARDLEKTRTYLNWLKREYPTSALARQVNGRLASLAGPGPAARAAAASNAPATAARTEAAPRAETATRTGAADPAPAKHDNAVAIRSVTRISLPRGDRILIELSREMPFAAMRLSGPDRIAIDLPDVQTAPAAAADVEDIRGAHVRRATLVRSAAGTRLVVELNGSPRFSTFPLYGPYRLAVDIEGEPGETPSAAATRPEARPAPPVPAAMPTTSAAPRPEPTRSPPPRIEPTTNATPRLEQRQLAPPPAPPASTSRGEFSLARQLGLGVSRIVIDPGHGGHDPGAKANGITEAGIVLDVALRLEKLLLEKPGFEVVLTRRTDEFVPLEARTALANREDADLFISIHANAGTRAQAQGVETFFLDFASNPQAEALAARENAASEHAMRELPTILRAIATNNKLDESRELARIVQSSLVRTLSANGQSGKDLGVKRAPFMVLIGAQMPSVLTEISFLTNKAEAGLLKQAAHRQKIARAIADAIVRYQGSLKKVSNVAANNN